MYIPTLFFNAAKHPKKWRRTTEPYLSFHSTHKTTESKVSIFENFRIYETSQIFSLPALEIFKRSCKKQPKTRKLAFSGLYGGKVLGTSYFERASVTGTRIFALKFQFLAETQLQKWKKRNTHRLSPCKGGSYPVFKRARGAESNPFYLTRRSLR